MDPISRNNRIYFDSVKQYPDNHKGVKWSSAESQFLRFKILCEIAPDLFESTILDVGCGLGHLVDYLIESHFHGSYKGIDLVYEMILKAQKRHPSYHFENNDLDSVSPNSYDYVLASGVFTFMDWASAQCIIPVLFSKAKKGIAFNCLSARADEKDENIFYPDSKQMLAFCQTITSAVILREDYLDNDFTIYMSTKS